MASHDQPAHDVLVAGRFTRNKDRVNATKLNRDYFKPGGQGDTSARQAKLETELQRQLPCTYCKEYGHMPGRCPKRPAISRQARQSPHLRAKATFMEMSRSLSKSETAVKRRFRA